MRSSIKLGLLIMIIGIIMIFIPPAMPFGVITTCFGLFILLLIVVGFLGSLGIGLMAILPIYVISVALSAGSNLVISPIIFVIFGLGLILLRIGLKKHHII